MTTTYRFPLEEVLVYPNGPDLRNCPHAHILPLDTPLTATGAAALMSVSFQRT